MENSSIDPTEFVNEPLVFQAPPVTTYGDYSSYMQAVTQYYSQPATANQAYASKVRKHGSPQPKL